MLHLDFFFPNRSFFSDHIDLIWYDIRYGAKLQTLFVKKCVEENRWRFRCSNYPPEWPPDHTSGREENPPSPGERISARATQVIHFFVSREVSHSNNGCSHCRTCNRSKVKQTTNGITVNIDDLLLEGTNYCVRGSHVSCNPMITFILTQFVWQEQRYSGSNNSSVERTKLQIWSKSSFLNICNGTTLCACRREKNRLLELTTHSCPHSHEHTTYKPLCHSGKFLVFLPWERQRLHNKEQVIK